jgi:hypothetical protein
MKNFSHLKEIPIELEDDKKEDYHKAIKMRDYIIGKYLKLIYLCLYQVHPENR